MSSLDHVPFNYDDVQGKKLGGLVQPFDHTLNGTPGIETRLPLLFDGITRGKLSLHQFVELTSYRPVRLYGLYPRKGAIAVGVDADITLQDPERHVRITNDALHHVVDYTLCEGIEVTGWPMYCFSRGEMLAENRKYFEPAPKRGQFLPAGVPSLV